MNLEISISSSYGVCKAKDEGWRRRTHAPCELSNRRHVTHGVGLASRPSEDSVFYYFRVDHQKICAG